jgi:hypothetical protein
MSRNSPFTFATMERLAREREIDSAMVRGVDPSGYSRRVPSGNVTFIIGFFHCDLARLGQFAGRMKLVFSENSPQAGGYGRSGGDHPPDPDRPQRVSVSLRKTPRQTP